MTAGTSTTSQVLHLRHLQTGLSGPSLPVDGCVTNRAKNCTCGISTDFCTVCTVYLSLWRNQKIHHSVGERSLRHLHVLDEGLP